MTSAAVLAHWYGKHCAPNHKTPNHTFKGEHLTCEGRMGTLQTNFGSHTWMGTYTSHKWLHNSHTKGKHRNKSMTCLLHYMMSTHMQQNTDERTPHSIHHCLLHILWLLVCKQWKQLILTLQHACTKARQNSWNTGSVYVHTPRHKEGSH